MRIDRTDSTLGIVGKYDHEYGLYRGTKTQRTRHFSKTVSNIRKPAFPVFFCNWPATGLAIDKPATWQPYLRLVWKLGFRFGKFGIFDSYDETFYPHIYIVYSWCEFRRRNNSRIFPRRLGVFSTRLASNFPRKRFKLTVTTTSCTCAPFSW